jgi:hypothetical protein
MTEIDDFPTSMLIAEAVARLAVAEKRTADLEAALHSALIAIDTLINESKGVDGLHLNGDMAPWGDLIAGGKYEEWLLPLEEARAALGRTGS